MKKFLMTIGAMFLALLGVVVITVVYAMYSGNALDVSSKAFVLSSLATMSHHWEPSEISSIASPELKKTMEAQPEQVRETFRELSTLGELINAQSITGGAYVKLNIGDSTVTTASYNGHADFKNGAANVSICLLIVEGQWRINCVTIDKDVSTI